MTHNPTKIENACAIVHNGMMIEASHLEALLNLDNITDLEMLQELTDDCLSIASCEEVAGLINPSFFKNMRWIVNYLRDLKKQPITEAKPQRTIEEIEADLAALYAKRELDGHE